jgi:hypothetical protein
VTPGLRSRPSSSTRRSYRAPWAVYLRATAVQIDGPDDGIEVFSRAAIADGMRARTMAHVTDDEDLRLYRANAPESSVLGTTTGSRDEPFSVDLAVTR